MPVPNTTISSSNYTGEIILYQLQIRILQASSPGPRLCPRVTRKDQLQFLKLNTRKVLNALVWKVSQENRELKLHRTGRLRDAFT